MNSTDTILLYSPCFLLRSQVTSRACARIDNMATRQQWTDARITPAHDKRRKLAPEDRARILALHKRGDYSQRELARAFGVSRRLITFVLYPERALHAAAQFKERRKDGRYYNKDDWRDAQRKHRAHLRKIKPALNEGNKPGDTIREYNARRNETKQRQNEN